MSQLRSPSTRLPDHDRPACAALCASTAAWPPSVCKYKTATQAKEGVGTGAYAYVARSRAGVAGACHSGTRTGGVG